MATLQRDITSLIADKAQARRIMDEQYALMGLTYDPTATAERAQALCIEAGLDPNGTSFSRGIIEERERKIHLSMGEDVE